MKEVLAEINSNVRILEWVKKMDLKTLHIIRKVIKLKKSSNLRKNELFSRIMNHYSTAAAIQIQRFCRRKLKGSKAPIDSAICPFTLEKPEWPYFINKIDGRVIHYYNLEPLVEYLGTIESRNERGEPRCPISRKAFAKWQVLAIKKLARTEDLEIPALKRPSKTEIEKKAIRSLLDDMVGDMTKMIAEFDKNHTMTNYSNYIRNIHNNIAPALLDNYLRIKRLDREEAKNYVKTSINTINQEYDNEIKNQYLHLFESLLSSSATP